MSTKVSVWKSRSQRDYTLAFKLKVIEEVEKGSLPYNKALLAVSKNQSTNHY